MSSVISSMSPNIDNETLRKIQDILKLSTNITEDDEDETEENKTNPKVDVDTNLKMIKKNKTRKGGHGDDDDNDRIVSNSQVKTLIQTISKLEEEVEFQNEESANIRSELKELQARINKLEKSTDGSSKLTDIWQKLDHLEQHLSARIKQVSNIATGHMEHNMELWNSLLSQQTSLVQDQKLMKNLEDTIKNMGDVVQEDLVGMSKNKRGGNNNGTVKKAIQGVMSMVKRGLNPTSAHSKHRRGSTSSSGASDKDDKNSEDDDDHYKMTPKIPSQQSKLSLMGKTLPVAPSSSNKKEDVVLLSPMSKIPSSGSPPSTNVKRDGSPKKGRSKSPSLIKDKRGRSASPTPSMKITQKDNPPKTSRSKSPPKINKTNIVDDSNSIMGNISSRTRSKTPPKTSGQFSTGQQCIFLSDYENDDESKQSDEKDDNNNVPDEKSDYDEDTTDENLPDDSTINDDLHKDDDEEEEHGWGSDLSDSDLIGSEHTTTLHGTDVYMKSMDSQSHIKNIGNDNHDINCINSNSQETGPHATLHELILAIGQLTNPTHEILDDIWLKLPTAQGLHYPTKTDIPNTLYRQAELLRVMIVLYESISNLAMENGNSPDIMYSNEHICNLSIGCNNCINGNEESLLTFIQ